VPKDRVEPLHPRLFRGSIERGKRRRAKEKHDSGCCLIELYQQPAIAETVNFDYIKRHYYITHDNNNPTRVSSEPAWCRSAEVFASRFDFASASARG